MPSGHLSLRTRSLVPPQHGAALVVDDETNVLKTVCDWLSSAGWRVIGARSTSEALKAAKDPSLTLALVDYRLEGGDEGIRLGHAIHCRYGVPFVLVSGYLNTSIIVTAMKAGALDVMDRPLSEARLLADLGTLISSRNPCFGPCGRGSISSSGDIASNDIRPAAVRWARLVLKACSAVEDPRRVQDWAEAVGASEGMIDEICRLCGVGSRHSRDIARILRAIHVARSTRKPVWTHLAISDERTISALLQRAAITRATRTVELQEFFVKQTFVATSKLCLRELAHIAANSPLFF